MNLKTWIKTIFMVYRHLPRIIDSIDKVFSARALNGGIMSGNAVSYNDVYNLTDNLIKLSQKKVALINLKVLAKLIVRNLDRDLVKMLILRFVDGFTAPKLAEHFNISERTVFRRINEALSMASMKAEELGYNKEKLENEFKDEKWLFDLGEVAENDDYIKIDNDYLKKVIREYKKFSYAN